MYILKIRELEISVLVVTLSEAGNIQATFI